MPRSAARTARWTAACLLARVDGLSPVEYLDEPARRRTRRVARALVADPSAGPAEVRAAWARSLGNSCASRVVEGARSRQLPGPLNPIR